MEIGEDKKRKNLVLKYHHLIQIVNQNNKRRRMNYQLKKKNIKLHLQKVVVIQVVVKVKVNHLNHQK